MKRSKIIEQQRLFLSYLPYVRETYGSIPGVETIGLGAKEKDGKLLEEWAFRFYVNEKRTSHLISAEELIPDRIFGVQTDVIPHFEKDALVCDSTHLSINDTEYRDQGIRGGISIRNEHFDNDQPSGYGTLGILARRKSDNKLVGLTCAHVVNAASESNTMLNTKIGQPKYWVSCCCCPRGHIGDVTKATFTDHLDCAVIEIHDDISTRVASNTSENKIEGFASDIAGATNLVCFDNVQKYGRATGLTIGRVTDVAYGTNQVLIERTTGTGPFACHGDSGAVIVNSENKAVALLVAAAQQKNDAGEKLPLTKAIATLIKPVMADLGITIAGTDESTIKQPVGGAPEGCVVHAWPGGKDPALNPIEKFNSTDFGLSGSVDWDVSPHEGKGVGATIIETGTTTASGLSSISVRYDTTSPSTSTNDAVWVKASGGGRDVTKFRTVFNFTPRTVNTAAALDGDNTKRFTATGGTNNAQAGVAKPGTDSATWFLAKAEIAYDILPVDIQWSKSGAMSFVDGAPAGTLGNIISRRQTKYTRGEQAAAATERTHTDQTTWISAGDSTAAEIQGPSDAVRNELFRLANEGLDPTNLIQGYWRSDFRDYLEFFDGTSWIRITGYAEWFANLTASQSGTGSPPPGVGAVNAIGAGTNAEKIPNQQPTVTINTTPQEVRFGALVTLGATPVDGDNDPLIVIWAKTAGPAVALSSLTGNSVTFNAPNDDVQFKFTATADDGTGGLSRTAGNNASNPAEAVVNVIEWLFRSGGYANNVDNETEVFDSANFGMAGPVNWDVSGGGTNGFIVETGTTNAAARNTITVRYDNASADQTIGNTVVIRATDNTGKTWFKRRTVVLTPEWAAWPGGQANTALNPTENITAVHMGFPAGTLLNWDVGQSLTNGLIVAAGGTTSNGVASIVVRFDTRSTAITAVRAVRIQATNPANGTVAIKLRTVFTVTPQAANTANNLHGLGGAGGAAGRNALRFPASDGTRTQAGVVNSSMAGVTRIAAKMEQVFTIAPLGIPWTRRLTSFVFDDGGAGTQITNSKYECRARRDRQAVFLHEGTAAGANRNFTIIAQGGLVANDAAMVNDGFADTGDCQYPTNAMPNHIFRLDWPGIGPAVAVRQLSFRSNFREYVAWHNGTAGAAGWSRITPYSAWFINLSMAPPTVANPHPNMIAPNTSGAGAGAVNLANVTPVINAGVDQAVSSGDVVTLIAAYTDGDDDPISGNFNWTQTSGTNVIPGGVFVGNPLVFTAPAAAGRLTFTVHADDNVVNANSYNPGNSRGTDTINVDVS